MIRGVILDVDGTLVDSNDAHARAWAETLAESGYDVPVEEVRPLIGMGSDKLLPAVTGIDAESPRGKELVERRKEIFTERYVPKLRPFPGVRELLERMRRDGLRLVVASSASEEDLEALLEIAGAQDLVQQETSSDDAERSKPDADIVAAALKKAGLRPEEAVMLGDTPYDVEAARRLGVGTIALRSGGWSDDDLAGAVAVFDDAADLLKQYDESPLARRRHSREPR